MEPERSLSKVARSNYRGGTARPNLKDLNRRIKKKPCALCRDRIDWVDYKDLPLLRKYMSDRGKIRSRRVTGNCAQHQRALALAIKTARELVLLPYTQRTVTERPSGRGGQRDGRGEGGYRSGDDDGGISLADVVEREERKNHTSSKANRETNDYGGGSTESAFIEDIEIDIDEDDVIDDMIVSDNDDYAVESGELS